MTSLIPGSERRVFFYVQHLLGVGHVFRALRIARQLAADRWKVTLVLGGVPIDGLNVAGIEVVQLPPVKAGTDGFTDLVQLDGAPADLGFHAARRDLLLAAFEHRQPDVLLVEAFPFGRRQMRFELLPLLDAARSAGRRPKVVCSVRDILQEDRKPGRDQETLDALARSFDLVIAHGDPKFVRLEETFPQAPAIACPLIYSGYIAPEPPRPVANPFYDVVVSAGGGAVGLSLLSAALDAKRHTSVARGRWLFLTGTNMPSTAAAQLQQRAGEHQVEIARFVPHLVDELSRTRVSVSQAGYNSVADILVAGCAAVYVPFAVGGETEQTRRAARLRDLGAAVVVSEADLDPRTLAAAIERALAMPNAPPPVALDGAARTSAILQSLFQPA